MNEVDAGIILGFTGAVFIVSPGEKSFSEKTVYCLGYAAIYTVIHFALKALTG